MKILVWACQQSGAQKTDRFTGCRVFCVWHEDFGMGMPAKRSGCKQKLRWICCEGWVPMHRGCRRIMTQTYTETGSHSHDA
eukprot:1159237-Pelagomonas_calceolata.AAC.7